jgi:hypothetical protein
MNHRKNLVIARVGRNSLHRTWLDATRARHWDLLLLPFQPLAEHPDDHADGVTVHDVIPGPKWIGLRQLLNGWRGWQSYDHIWLPDDDIHCSQDTVNRMFGLAEALHFDLCAPALQEGSYYAHFSTMRNPRFAARRTGFVEIMVPCFRREALQRLLPTLDLSTTGWGWGLDSLWPRRLEYRGLGVLDATPVLHTRPVGAFRDAALGQAVHAESDRIMAEHRCRQVHTTFEGIGVDLKPMALDEAALTAALADGWRYLWQQVPAVLPWIVQAQQPPQGWPAYPVEGLPASSAARTGATA